MSPFLLAVIITIAVAIAAGRTAIYLGRTNGYVEAVALTASTVTKTEIPSFVEEDSVTLNDLHRQAMAGYRFSLFASVINIIQLVGYHYDKVGQILMVVTALLTAYSLICGYYLGKTIYIGARFNDKYDQIKQIAEDSCKNDPPSS